MPLDTFLVVMYNDYRKVSERSIPVAELADMLHVPVVDEETKILLHQLHEDLHGLLDFMTAPDEVWRQGVSIAHPLYITKRNRLHLYIYSPTTLAAVYSDLPTPIGTTTLAPFAVTAGKFIEIPFEEATQIAFPAVTLAAEVTVLLIARNSEIAFNG